MLLILILVFRSNPASFRCVTVTSTSGIKWAQSTVTSFLSGISGSIIPRLQSRTVSHIYQDPVHKYQTSILYSLFFLSPSPRWRIVKRFPSLNCSQSSTIFSFKTHICKLGFLLGIFPPLSLSFTNWLNPFSCYEFSKHRNCWCNGKVIRADLVKCLLMLFDAMFLAWALRNPWVPHPRTGEPVFMTPRLGLT